MRVCGIRYPRHAGLLRQALADKADQAPAQAVTKAIVHRFGSWADDTRAKQGRERSRWVKRREIACSAARRAKRAMLLGNSAPPEAIALFDGIDLIDGIVSATAPGTNKHKTFSCAHCTQADYEFRLGEGLCHACWVRDNKLSTTYPF